MEGERVSSDDTRDTVTSVASSEGAEAPAPEKFHEPADGPEAVPELKPKTAPKPKRKSGRKPRTVNLGNVGLSSFGGGVALMDLGQRSGYGLRSTADGLEECSQPPELMTLPGLAWDSQTGRLVIGSLTHDQTGVFANVKFDEGTGKIVAVSQQYILMAQFIMEQRSSRIGMGMLPQATFAVFLPFCRAVHDERTSLKFPRGLQPGRRTMFHPLMGRVAVKRKDGQVEHRVGMCRAMQHRAPGTMHPGGSIVAYARTSTTVLAPSKRSRSGPTTYHVGNAKAVAKSLVLTKGKAAAQQRTKDKCVAESMENHEYA